MSVSYAPRKFSWSFLIVAVLCAVSSYIISPLILSKDQQGALSSWLPERSINLGLDLQGGSYLLLEVDNDQYFDEQLAHMRSTVRQALRSEKIGYNTIEVRDDAVYLELRKETWTLDEQPEVWIKRVLGGVQVESEGDTRFTVRVNEQEMKQRTSQLVTQTIEILSRRIDETGTKEPLIQRQGNNRILLQVAGMSNPDQVKKILGTTAQMNFHLVDERATPEALMNGDVPIGSEIFYGEEQEGQAAIPYALNPTPALMGDTLVDANPSVGEMGQPIVSFRFNNQGARLFGEITQANVGKRFAVVLDGKVITAPQIRSPILEGTGVIEGGFTAQSASDLALLLRAGALPADVRIVEERSVGPSLGADSIAAGMVASIVSVVLVVVFMLISYGLLGLFASVALCVNMLLLFACLTLLQATLTLPGIAGIVLTLGMAVDANVLIYERIKEEFRRGIALSLAIERGFKGAFATILDSNITTLIAALILFFLGSGAIKGFAVTLSLGIITSMFSAILVTRILVTLWLNAGRSPRVTLPL
ncbi:MAG: protein translocase subunit SecD [Alphaproteobacteria bacterium]|nr:MAG: protein translocase subunit SecD [Alphaproteobacteria bacterium]TAF41699.1 MAG: protein translocase subunit SecD [Alphaproteobacteria bacterium]TAF75640.1 MAG: protein translocase subunit SecD [Alphaproteobacteria bacterium]